MASYAQWVNLAQKNDHKRLSWVCGPEFVLRDEVVRATVEASGASPEAVVRCYLPGMTEKEFWSEAFTLPLVPTERRCVVLRGAERLKHPERLADLAASYAQAPNVWLVMESTAKDLEAETPAGETIRKKGRLVKCSTPKEEVLRDWVLRQAPPGTTIPVAEYAVRRAAGDLVKLSGAMAKARVLGGVNPPILDLLMSESVEDEYVDALIRGDRRTALMAASGIGSDDQARTLSLLLTRMEQMDVVVRSVRSGMTNRDIARVVPGPVAAAMLPHAAKHDPGSTLRRRGLLAVASEARGEAGALELVAARW